MKMPAAVAGLRGLGGQAGRVFMLILALQGTLALRRDKRSTTECPSSIRKHHKDLHVYITINSVINNPLFGDSKLRKIELNWNLPKDPRPTDWVGLFKRNPETRLSVPLVKVNATRSGHGYFKTRFSFPQSPLLGQNSPLDTCLFGFWIGYIRNGKALRSNCVHLRPNWMWNDRKFIGNIPLYALMIPGTHNAGSFKVMTPSSSYNVVDRYSICQGEDIWNQLLYGIRYLDIRVGYYSDTPERFWVVHNFVKMNPLYVVIQDVRKFMLATNEIVIMDFHRFPFKFTEEVHKELELYLEEELGEFMAPDWVGRNVSPDDLWHLNKTLIVAYHHPITWSYNSKIWPDVQHAWGNKRGLSELTKYLSDQMIRHYTSKYLWAAMAHLTPSQWDVFTSPNGGFAKLSDKIAREMTEKFRHNWWDSANIVATDYFLGNNIIEESILANRRRSWCRKEIAWQ